jgi:hypothetical protein
VLLVFGEEMGVAWLASALNSFFVFHFRFIQQAAEKKIRELLNDGQGVGEAAGPKFSPKLVYFVAQIASGHQYFSNSEAGSIHGRIIK